ncbi:MAG: FlgD immunoglobulin-like domain containing protein, partial [bacterium]
NNYPGWYIDDVEAWGWKTGIVSGYVYDVLTREPISRASVRGAGRAALSVSTGRYVMYNVPVGYQEFTAYKEGYFPSIQRALVTDSDTARVNFPMYRIQISPDPQQGHISYAHTDSFPLVICNPTNSPITYNLSPDGNPRNVRWDLSINGARNLPSIEGGEKFDGQRATMRRDYTEVRTSMPETRSGEPSTERAYARPMARGDVLLRYPMSYPVSSVWGVGVQNLDYFWVSDAMATNHDYRFRADTNATVYTGVHYRFYWTPGIRDGFPADMAWDGRNMWQISAGGSNKIYAFDVFTGNVVDSIADPAMIWTSTWQVGLAYDPDEDCFYVGRWYSWSSFDGGVIYKIKGKRRWYTPGAIVDSIYNDYCAGLAFHPTRKTLFIAENSSPDRIIEVDFETGQILTTIPAPGPVGSAYGMGGAEIDQLGRLWVVNQNDQTVYVLDLDYRVYPQGVSVRPSSGVIPAGMCDTVWVVVEGHTLEPGEHTFNIYIYFQGQTVPSQFTVTINVQPTLNRGWNLIAVPVRPDPDDIYLQLRDDLIPFYVGPLRSSIWRLKADEGRYVVPERFMRGEGYYIMSYQPNVNFDVTGIPYTSDTTMYLPYNGSSRYPGWYLIGNPFNSAINWDATVYDPLFANVDPTYYALTELGWATYSPYAPGGASKWIEPWQGFMVRVTPSASGFGVIPFKKDPVTPPPVMKQVADKPNKKEAVIDIPFTLRISARTASGTWDAYNYMGVRTGATDGIDMYDVNELDMPLPGSEPSFKGYFLYGGTTKLARDTRSYFNGQKNWTFVVEGTNGTSVTLIWPANKLPDETDDSYGINRIDSRYSFFLVDNLTGTRKNMRTDTTYTFTITATGRREFTVEVMASTVGADEPQTLPKEFELSQNYPNPFNAATMIKFALPKDTKVELNIYNVLGENVRTLLMAEKKAGYYEIIWDGRNDSGIELPSGVYFLRMKAGDFKAEKKLMMIK